MGGGFRAQLSVAGPWRDDAGERDHVSESGGELRSITRRFEIVGAGSMGFERRIGAPVGSCEWRAWRGTRAGKLIRSVFR